MATVLARKVSIPLKGLRRRMRLGLVASLMTCQVGQSWLIYSERNPHKDPRRMNCCSFEVRNGGSWLPWHQADQSGTWTWDEQQN